MQKVVVQILRTPIGGIRKHVFDILESVSVSDAQQIFITNTTDTDAELPQYANLKTYNIAIHDQPHLKDLGNIFQIYKILKSYKVDVIHGHGAKGGIYARILSFLLGHAKCIYTPHGGSLHRVYGKLKNKIYDLVELVFMPLTDVYLFESKYSCNEFTKNVGDAKNKSIINYNGVDIPAKKAVNIYKAGEKLKLASFGLLRHLKGHDIAIEACAMLARENIPFEYTIYGRGEEEATLLALIEKYGLHDSVHIKNYSGNVLEEMLKFDFIIHSSRFESFGYVPVEAMSLGVPVVVSAEGGLKEVVDDECGYVAVDNKAETYFTILKKIYTGDQDLEKKIQSASSRVEMLFSKSSMLKKITEIYWN